MTNDELTELKMDNEAVCVVAFNKITGYMGTSTSCNREDAPRYAKYYRSIGYNARILTYEELDTLQENEKQKRYK